MAHQCRIRNATHDTGRRVLFPLRSRHCEHAGGGLPSLQAPSPAVGQS
jgi:hypothetical protein